MHWPDKWCSDSEIIIIVSYKTLNQLNPFVVVNFNIAKDISNVCVLQFLLVGLQWVGRC